MTPTPISQTAVRAVLGDRDAKDAMAQRRVAQLSVMHPSAFEGTPESGPYTPRTRADDDLSAARSSVRRVRTDAALTAEATIAGLAGTSISDAALFCVAAYADVSPLYAMRRAVELAPDFATCTRADEARVSARMRAQEANR